MSRHDFGPRPSVPNPRRHLLDAVLSFVRAARSLPGVRRIALVGSLTTDKPVPKDADVLVTIPGDMELGPLARIGRSLKGSAQKINLSADIFLADEGGRYIGRTCSYSECHPRRSCEARGGCREGRHLNDDLHVVTLNPELVSAPPIELWPRIVARCAVPPDTHAMLIAKLEADGTPSGGRSG
jgi:hypothetical protein